MCKKIKVLIFLIFISTCLFGQNQSNNIETLQKINIQINNLSIDSTLLFLKLLDAKSINNIEFVEYWNETLFKILDKYPDNYLLCMCQLPETNDWELVFNQIENPIHDYDLEKIKIKLSDYKILKDDCQLLVLKKTFESIDNIHKSLK